MPDVRGPGEPCTVECEGDLITVLEETSYVVTAVYEAIRKKSPEAGEFYKKAWYALVNSEESPLWTDDIYSGR